MIVFSLVISVLRMEAVRADWSLALLDINTFSIVLTVYVILFSY